MSAATTAAPPASACKGARDLLELAIAHDWTVAWQPDEDSGGAPFVTVRAIADRGAVDIRVTWHTRNTGTYRMTSAISRGGARGWHDITLAQARELIAGGPR